MHVIRSRMLVYKEVVEVLSGFKFLLNILLLLIIVNQFAFLVP